MCAILNFWDKKNNFIFYYLFTKIVNREYICHIQNLIIYIGLKKMREWIRKWEIKRKNERIREWTRE